MSQTRFPTISSYLVLAGMALVVLTFGVVYTINTMFTSLNKSKDVSDKGIVEAGRVNVSDLDKAISKMLDRNIPALDLPN